MRLQGSILLVLVGLCVQACGGDDDGGAGGGVSVGVGRDGGGMSGGPFIPPGGSGEDDSGMEDDDAGAAGAGGGSGGTGGSPSDGGIQDMGSRCRDVDPVPVGVDPDPTELYNRVTSPLDLVVTRASATWELGCVQPTLRITVSDGACPEGRGHELTFFLPADGVEESMVVLGQNLIMEESTPGLIRVRYTRPAKLDPDGRWGTCEDASGTLDLVGELELREGRTIQGSFLLDLTRCDDGAPSLQQLEGSFNVEVPATLATICP